MVSERNPGVVKISDDSVSSSCLYSHLSEPAFCIFFGVDVGRCVSLSLRRRKCFETR